MVDRRIDLEMPEPWTSGQRPPPDVAGTRRSCEEHTTLPQHISARSVLGTDQAVAHQQEGTTVKFRP